MLFPVAGHGRPDATEQHQGGAGARGGGSVSMRDLLASCAAARAVSVPPAPASPATREDRPAREAA